MKRSKSKLKLDNGKAKPRSIRITDSVWAIAHEKASDDNRTVSNWVAALIRNATKD